MPTITVLPDAPGSANGGFRAVAGREQSVGPTVGQALDALTAQIGPPQETTRVVVQPQTADEFFSESQCRRLTELMGLWREARETGRLLSPAEQAELDALTQAELKAAGERAAALLRQVAP